MNTRSLLSQLYLNLAAAAILTGAVFLPHPATGAGRVLAWGGNFNGQLGNNSTAQSGVPLAVSTTGVLAGKTVTMIATGSGFSLVLCNDGTLVAWGQNTYGQLGDGTTTQRLTPVAVNTGAGSALNGKTVTAIAAGSAYCLALCADGKVVAWGWNRFGQLGTGVTNNSYLPVAVSSSGVLSGRTVTAIAAGSSHNLALCSDHSLVAWGYNTYGQIGDGSTTTRLSPVSIGGGALSGKVMAGIACGGAHSLVRCTDGTVAAWGYNGSGQLGNNDGMMNNSSTPVAVDTSASSYLNGKWVTALAAGGNHSLALCSDGTVSAWGDCNNGQLGVNAYQFTLVPLAVSTAAGVSALYGKTVTAVAAGSIHSMALCSDGTLAAWGDDAYGELGDNGAATQLAPVAVNSGALSAGESFNGLATGPAAVFCLALAATPPVAAITVSGNGITVTNGARGARGADGTDFGTISALGGAVTRTFAITNNGTATLNLTGTPRVSISGPQAGQFSVTQMPVSTVAAGGGGTTFQITATATAAGVRTADVSIASDAPGSNPYTFTIQVRGVSGTLTASYTNGTEVPLAVGALTAAGNLINLSLNYAPPVGTSLMVVNNTGLPFISGTFDNLTNGQPVSLSYAGTKYDFVANYHGGNGNDLVLVWAKTRVYAWGDDSVDQFGDGRCNTNSTVPVPTQSSGGLAGKTVIGLAANGTWSLAVCSDGSIAAWGYTYNVVMDTPSNRIVSLLPMTVDAGVNSALHGRTAVAVAGGKWHSLALCSDGTVAAWGDNTSGQLGNNTRGYQTNEPVAVYAGPGSALYGKSVVASAAGGYHSLALCSDGTVAAWGDNYDGQLGNGTTNQSSIPVAVSTDFGSALYGKTVQAIACGEQFSLALCSDGTVVAWGGDGHGELGDDNYPVVRSLLPVAVSTAFGSSALYGKTVTAIAAGAYHSLALCSDGAIVAWGEKDLGQLGDGNNVPPFSYKPVAVSTASGSALQGKAIQGVAIAIHTSYAFCQDGTGVAWGNSWSGLLGNGVNGGLNDFTNKPVSISMASFAPGERLLFISGGESPSHVLALVARPATVVPVLTTLVPSIVGGVLSVSFANTPGAVFTVQVSSDLTNWTTLGPATETAAGQFLFTDAVSTNAARFYRIVSP